MGKALLELYNNSYICDCYQTWEVILSAQNVNKIRTRTAKGKATHA